MKFLMADVLSKEEIEAVAKEELSLIEQYMEVHFKQMELTGVNIQITVLVSKKGKVTIKKKKIRIILSS